MNQQGLAELAFSTRLTSSVSTIVVRSSDAIAAKCSGRGAWCSTQRCRIHSTASGCSPVIAYTIVKPPLTDRTCPVIHEESGQVRNRAALAMSCGSPIRPSG